jgi:hypothetical protein
LSGGTLHQRVYRHYHGAANGRCIRSGPRHLNK